MNDSKPLFKCTAMTTTRKLASDMQVNHEELVTMLIQMKDLLPDSFVRNCCACTDESGPYFEIDETLYMYLATQLPGEMAATFLSAIVEELDANWDAYVTERSKRLPFSRVLKRAKRKFEKEKSNISNQSSISKDWSQQ